MSNPSERRVISITGEDRFKFLQGVITNDVAPLKNGEMIYAALLTPQGKFIVDFFLAPEGDRLLVDVLASEAEMLLKRLTMYRMRSKAELSLTDLTVSRGVSATPDGAFADPRHPQMGWRAYDGRPSETADWDALRVAHCIPQTGIELTADTFILEAGFEALRGVDFKKGCYVGQEVTARMKHKTELRKGLVQVAIDGQAPVGSVLRSEDGKEAGTLYTQSGDKALAHIRFDRAKGPLNCDGAVVTWPPAAEA